VPGSANPATSDPAVRPQPDIRPIDTARVLPPGRLRDAYRLIQPATESLLGFGAIWKRYDACRADDPDAVTFSRRFLAASGVEPRIEPGLESHLSAIDGPLLVVANHPFGGMEFFALVGLLESVRPGGWKFLANPGVCRIPRFQNAFIPLDPLRPTAPLNRRGLIAAARHLQEGGLLGIFPAGRVSRRDPSDGAIADLPWSDHAVRLASAAKAAVAVLHIPGHNSRTFLRIPTRWAHLRALMLARELARPAVRQIEIRHAASLDPGEVAKLARAAAPAPRLQAWCLLRADADIPRPVSPASRTNQPQIAPPASPSFLRSAAEACAAEHRICQSGPFDLLLVRGAESPALMHELGRIREIAFRAAGQGTGRTLDLSPEDRHYHHLLLWDRDAARLAGAYRVGMVEEILKSHGSTGLYLNQVFKVRPGFYRRVSPAIELSRSFVIPDYQRDKLALAALWKGLGAAAARHRIRTLFGSVTISNQHHPATRALLVEYLRRNHSDTAAMRRLIRARHPFQPLSQHHLRIAATYDGEPIERLSPLVEKLEAGQRGIPPLMRYYCSLGAKFLACHVEPAFADALYCLLRVDLACLPPAYKRRFFRSATSDTCSTRQQGPE